MLDRAKNCAFEADWPTLLAVLLMAMRLQPALFYKRYFHHVQARPVFFFTLPACCHHNPAFSIQSIIHIGQSSPTISSVQSQDHRLFLLVCRPSHLWSKFPPTLRVHYQFDPSSSPSSSPSSGSGPGPLVHLSRGIFYCHLKTFLFSKSFPP